MREQGDSTAPAQPVALAHTSCIEIEELVAMTDGSLAPERVEEILVHVDACDICAEVIANLGAIGEQRRAEIGRYQLANVLGAGGMGIVYEAWDPQLRRRVALKLVRPEQADAESHSRMLREARALARVSHPNVVTVYEVTEDGGQICVATELVDGETLASWQTGKTTDQIIDAWLQAARGLAAAHAVGVVHRDVKPMNVFVGRDGRVRVGDFGLARLGDDATIVTKICSSPALDATLISATGTVAGTPAYMSPEQAEGHVDARSDQYALCVSLAEALTGVWPKPNSVPPIDRPAGLREVLACGLRADPRERFDTMDAFVAALQRVMVPRRRRWPFVAAGGLGALAVGGVVVWALQTPPRACAIDGVPTDVWSPERRAQIVTSLGEAVAARVDAYLSAWSAASADLCSDVRDDDALRARRRSCLGDELARLEVRLDKLTPTLARASAHDMLESIPLPNRCSRTLLAGEPDPTPAQRQWHEPWRQLSIHGREISFTELQRWWQEARTKGFAMYAVEAADALATAQATMTSPAAGRETLREAVTIAETGGSDLAWILANNRYLSVLADQPADALRIAEAVRSRIAKKAGGSELEGNLDYTLSTALFEPTQQITALERARSEFRDAYGPDSLHEATILLLLSNVQLTRDPNSKDAVTSWNACAKIFERLGLPDRPPPTLPDADPQRRVAELTKMRDFVVGRAPSSVTASDAEDALASAYVIAEQDMDALEHYRRAIKIRDTLGIHDGSYASSLSQMAMLLNMHQRPREALPLAQYAVAIAAKLGLDSVAASANHWMGRALLDTGDAAAALQPLEDALRLREQNHDPPRQRAGTLFLLARATWHVDHAKATQYAISAATTLDTARTALGHTPADEMYRHDLDKLEDQIKRWNKRHE